MVTHTNNSVNNNFNKDSAHRGQSQNRDNFLPVVNLDHEVQWITNPWAFFSDWRNKGVAKVMNVILTYSNRHLNVYPRQDTIAYEADMTREYVNRLLKRCHDLGLINKHWRAYTSCIYTVHPIFNDLNFRQRIMDLLPSLWYLPLLLLVGISTGVNAQFKPGKPGNLTVSINSNSLYIKKLLAIAIKKYNNQYQVDHRVVTKDGKTHISLYQKDMKQKIMESVAMSQPLFSEGVIAAAEFLKLSMAGKCNLSAYDDKVIAIAMQRLKGYGKEIAKPFNMLMKLCNEISHEMGIAIVRSRAYQVASQFSITLGVDDNILPGCDKPLKPNTHQREVYKPSPTQNKQFAPKSARSYSSNTNTRPHTKTLTRGPNLSRWRQTTQEERDAWNEEHRTFWESEQGRRCRAMGLVIPAAPDWVLVNGGGA